MPERAAKSPAVPALDSVSCVVRGNGAFPTTQWSMISRAGTNTDTQARAALESLCRRYWQPLYLYVRRQGRDHHDAEDATQQFLVQLLADDGLQRAQPERGRFRTFLLTGLRNYLTSEWRRTQTEKRGGGLTTIPIPPGSADNAASIALGTADPGMTPEQAFDRRWAQSMIDHAVLSLRAEYESSGRHRIFDALAPLIWGDLHEDDFPMRAEAIGLTVNSFRVALHRARRRLGERLRAHVAETVADPTEIDAELRYLVSALSRNVAGA